MFTLLGNKLRKNAPQHFRRHWKTYATVGLVVLAILLTMYAFPVSVTTLLAGWLGTYTAIEPLFMLSMMLEGGGVFASMVAGLMVGIAVAVATQVFRFANYLARQFYNSYFLDSTEWKKAFAFLFPTAVSGTTAVVALAAGAIATAATGGIVTAIIFGSMLTFLVARLLVSRFERWVNPKCDLITLPSPSATYDFHGKEVHMALRSRLDHPNSYFKVMNRRPEPVQEDVLPGYKIYKINKENKFQLLMETSESDLHSRVAREFGGKFPPLNTNQLELTFWERLRGKTLYNISNDEIAKKNFELVSHKSIRFEEIQSYLPKEPVPVILRKEEEMSAFAKCCAALCKKTSRPPLLPASQTRSDAAVVAERKSDTSPAVISSAPAIPPVPAVQTDKPHRFFGWFSRQEAGGAARAESKAMPKEPTPVVVEKPKSTWTNFLHGRRKRKEIVAGTDAGNAALIT